MKNELKFVVTVCGLLLAVFLSSQSDAVTRWPTSAAGDTTYTVPESAARSFTAGQLPTLEKEFTAPGGLNVSGYTTFEWYADGAGVKVQFISSVTQSATVVGRVDSVLVVSMGSASSLILTAK